MCPVPNEVRVKYIEIIDDILAKSDLTAVTEKSIRNGIQGRVEYDITPQKVVYERSSLGAEADRLGCYQAIDHGKV